MRHWDYQLLLACDDKQEAERELHVHAAWLKDRGLTDEFRVRVMYVRGWGVWLIPQQETTHSKRAKALDRWNDTCA
jgi:hypothetical protein